MNPVNPINPINRASFYNKLRQAGLFTTISQSQLDGMEAILNEWDNRKLSDLRWLAYMLATVYHETAKTMRAIEEYGKGKNYPYGRKLKRSKVAYTSPDKVYYGRGLVQLTWYENYELLGRLLHIDLLNHPELALDKDIAVQIMFEGMLRAASSFGDFTGKCLEMYFNKDTDDPVNARRIINGMDCAEKIAGHYRNFHTALS